MSMNDIPSFRREFAFLSNFHPAVVEFEGLVFPTVEHAYVAQKTLHQDIRREVLTYNTPGQVKRFGRTLWVRPDWDAIKFDIMLALVRLKFKHKSLADLLLDTKDIEIVERNNYWGDRYWGVCNGRGENNLGKILMTVRDELNIVCD